MLWRNILWPASFIILQWKRALHRDRKGCLYRQLCHSGLSRSLEYRYIAQLIILFDILQFFLSLNLLNLHVISLHWRLLDFKKICRSIVTNRFWYKTLWVYNNFERFNANITWSTTRKASMLLDGCGRAAVGAVSYRLCVVVHKKLRWNLPIYSVLYNVHWSLSPLENNLDWQFYWQSGWCFTRCYAIPVASQVPFFRFQHLMYILGDGYRFKCQRGP